MRRIASLTPALLLLLIAMPAHAQTAPADSAFPASSVDHVPIAVRSLAAAESAYAALGFRLKPGREHANGLRNAFAKFADGSYLELITPERGAVDGITTEYAEFLERHEGGAFLSLRTDSLDPVARRMRAAGYEPNLSRYGNAFSTLGFPESDAGWMFFIQYHTPVVDAPELLEHPNTAVGIERVHLSTEAYDVARRLDPCLWGGRADWAVSDAHGGPTVAGVTLRVRDVEAARALIWRTMAWELPLNVDHRGRSIIISPLEAHGIWIELLEPAPAP